MVYSSNLELDEAIFSRGTIRVGGIEYATPLKAYPAKKLIDAEQSPKPDSRQVAEIYCRIDTTDLEEYENFVEGEQEDPPEFIEDKIEPPLDEVGGDELVFAFFEIDETQELGKEDIQRYIRLSRRYSDFIVMPHQVGIVRRIVNSLGRGDPDEPDLPDNLYRAYYNGVSEFLEQTGSISEPVMAMLPLFGSSHRRNTHLEDFAHYDVEGICIDFRQQNPGNVDELRHIINGIRNRGQIENTFLYALNPRYTSFETDAGFITAEDYLLGAQAFDIIGENHFGFGGGNNGPIRNIRVFDGGPCAYRDVRLAELWQVCGDSGFAAGFLERNPEQAVDSKRLLSCEQIEVAFSELRTAIDAGEAFEYLRSKEGVSPEALEPLTAFYDFYTLAQEGGLTNF